MRLASSTSVRPTKRVASVIADVSPALERWKASLIAARRAAQPKCPDCIGYLLP